MHAPFGLSWSYLLVVPLVVALVIVGVRMLKQLRKCPPGVEPRDATTSLASAFLILPYLQLGDSPALSAEEKVELWWHARHDRRQWQVQVKVAGERCWREPVKAERTECDIPKMDKHLQFRAVIDQLPPGCEFDYRVLRGNDIAFAARGKARTHCDKFTFAVPADIGEFGQEAMAEHKVAYQLLRTKPDFLIIDGDIAYTCGRVSDYLKNVFPVYNSTVDHPAYGAPILRSLVAMPAPGNHDMGMPNVEQRPDFTRDPDALGYFLFWSPPLNGPCTKAEGNVPPLKGDKKARYRFAVNAGDRYPRIGMYSFDWGNAHFTVLDSNAYVDWSDAELRAWVAADLARAQKATWRFVVMHHPAFSSHFNHINEQRMRLLANLFERCNVDVVFSGHNHCYERSRPLRFKEDRLEGRLLTENCPVSGTFQIDTAFDGVKNTRPNGVVYVGCGASGASFNPNHKPNADQLQPFTAFFDQTVHSFTHVSIDRRRFELRQISEDGTEIDRLVIQK